MTERERAELEQLIRDNGQYPVTGELTSLSALFSPRIGATRRSSRSSSTSMRRWMELAEERLAGTGIRCFVTPGNDDFWVDRRRAHAARRLVEFVEGRCVRLDDHHEMITTGYSNITPWKSPRELDEDALSARLEAMFARRRGPREPGRRPALPASRHRARPGARDRRRVPRQDARAARCAWGRSGRPRCATSSSSTSRCSALHGHVHESKGAESTRPHALHQPRLRVHLGRAQLRDRLALRREAARVPVHDRMTPAACNSRGGRHERRARAAGGPGGPERRRRLGAPELAGRRRLRDPAQRASSRPARRRSPGVRTSRSSRPTTPMSSRWS